MRKPGLLGHFLSVLSMQCWASHLLSLSLSSFRESKRVRSSNELIYVHAHWELKESINEKYVVTEVCKPCTCSPWRVEGGYREEILSTQGLWGCSVAPFLGKEVEYVWVWWAIVWITQQSVRRQLCYCFFLSPASVIKILLLLTNWYWSSDYFLHPLWADYHPGTKVS